MLPLVRERFEAELEGLCPEGRLVLAVSGGGDSVALMFLVHELGREAVVAHLDHGLRPESAEDAAFVRRLAERLGFPAVIERVDVARIAREKRENLEAIAREVRYAFLARVAKAHGARCILTAHTADDQAETVLFQLFTGTARALGVRKERGAVKRPLLFARRRELRAYLEARGVPWREDSTNLDLARDRAYLRHEVLPRVEARFPGAVPALSRFAEARQAEEDWLEAEAAGLLRSDPRFPVANYRTLPLLKAPPPLRARALKRVLEGARVRPEARALAALEEALRGGKAALPGGVLARGYAGALFLIPPEEAPAPVPDGLSPCAYRKDLPMVGGGRLGEFFRARGVPPELRRRWPIGCREGRVAWIRGLYPEPLEDRWMRRALALARAAARKGEVPVGAVLARGEEVLAEAKNEVRARGDPTAHAELLALKSAFEKGLSRLSGATLYVSLEPCPMCFGALVEAGLGRLVYATENEKMGAFTVHRLRPPFPVVPGRFGEQSARLLSGFFARLRSEGCRSG